MGIGALRVPGYTGAIFRLAGASWNVWMGIKWAGVVGKPSSKEWSTEKAIRN